ncbi:hypothetical protein MCEMSE6_02690 [Oxalobacteraceae bacterium]
MNDYSMYKHTKHTKAHWSYRPVTSKETNTIFLETKEQCEELILESYSKLLLIGLITDQENKIPDLTKKDLLSSRKYIKKTRDKSIEFLKNSGIPHKIVDSLPLYFLVVPISKKVLSKIIDVGNLVNIPEELHLLGNFLKSRHHIRLRQLSIKNKNSSGKVVLKNNFLKISPNNKTQTSIKTAFEFAKLKKV